MESNRLVVLLGPSSSDISSLPSMRGFNLNNVLMASLFIGWKSCHLRRLTLDSRTRTHKSWMVVYFVGHLVVSQSVNLCGVSSKKKFKQRS